eukprot:11201950-Karenia_brevis.AAC.1
MHWIQGDARGGFVACYDHLQCSHLNVRSKCPGHKEMHRECPSLVVISFNAAISACGQRQNMAASIAWTRKNAQGGLSLVVT